MLSFIGGTLLVTGADTGLAAVIRFIGKIGAGCIGVIFTALLDDTGDDTGGGGNWIAIAVAPDCLATVAATRFSGLGLSI